MRMNVKVSASGLLTDTTGLPPRSINIFVSAAEAMQPSVALEQSPSVCTHDPSGRQLRWEASAGASYYRILHDGRHLWSTVETELTLEEQTGEFAVHAVDRFGVASAGVACDEL